MQTELSKKYTVKVVPYKPSETEKWLQWFKTSFRLPDNTTKNSYSNGVTEEQYQTNNPTKPYIIPLQVLNSSKGRP